MKNLCARRHAGERRLKLRSNRRIDTDRFAAGVTSIKRLTMVK
jgi:hypothetical protein